MVEQPYLILIVTTMIVILAFGNPMVFAKSNDATVIIERGASDPNNDKMYTPAKLNVSKGTTVVWRNDDTTFHTVTSGNPDVNDSAVVFDSDLIRAGNTFKWTFDNEGTFEYYCTLHPIMRGTVVVSSGSNSSQSNNANTPE